MWIHSPLNTRQRAADQLALRLLAEEQDLTVVVTTGNGRATRRPADARLLTPVPPGEDAAAAAAFVTHWRPTAGIWLTGYLRPPLMTQLRKSGVPMLLAEAEEDAFAATRLSLAGPQTRRAVDSFDTWYAVNGNAARRLARLGADPARIAITGPLQEGGGALPCNEEDRDDLATELTGRPIWLAAMAHPEELDVILEAHRTACRLAHRLILVLVPDNPETADAMARRLARENWRFQRWSEGEMPRETTQILLADTRGDMGLWYRLSPISLMAGSMTRGLRGHDPFEPAALGSAILYGPHVSGHLASYTRLAQAGAARLVRDADALSSTVLRLLAPDLAAAMATAAWEVSTEGAETTDRAVAWVQSQLDDTRRETPQGGARGAS